MGPSIPRVTLRVLGNDLAIESEDGRVAELMRLLWDPLVVDAPTSTKVVIRVRSRGGRVRVAREPGGGSFDGWEGDAGDLWPLMLTIRYAIGDVAIERAGEGVVIHAAVAATDGGATLLVGPNGTGKTTLVLEMLQAGWAYLSDDLAPVAPDGRVIPFPKPLGIRGDAGRWSHLLHLWNPPAWVPEPTGSFLIPATSFAVAGEPIAPRLVLFPVYSPQAPPEGAFESLSAAQALAAIGEQANRVDGGSLRAISSWLQTLPAYRIHYSSAVDVLSGVEIRTL
jgi:hypothetical protein